MEPITEPVMDPIQGEQTRRRRAQFRAGSLWVALTLVAFAWDLQLYARVVDLVFFVAFVSIAEPSVGVMVGAVGILSLYMTWRAAAWAWEKWTGSSESGGLGCLTIMGVLASLSVASLSGWHPRTALEYMESEFHANRAAFDEFLDRRLRKDPTSYWWAQQNFGSLRRPVNILWGYTGSVRVQGGLGEPPLVIQLEEMGDFPARHTRTYEFDPRRDPESSWIREVGFWEGTISLGDGWFAVHRKEWRR